MRSSEKNLQKAANKIAVFEDKKIRRVFHLEEWYFSIINVKHGNGFLWMPFRVPCFLLQILSLHNSISKKTLQVI